MTSYLTMHVPKQQGQGVRTRVGSHVMFSVVYVNLVPTKVHGGQVFMEYW